MNKVVIIDAATAMLHVSLLCTLLGVGEVMKVSLDCQEIDGSKEEVAPLIQQLQHRSGYRRAVDRIAPAD